MNKKCNGYISPFRFQLLQSFPYIVEDFDQYTEYQLFCKLVEKVNEVIGNENEITKQINEIKEYLDTLDLQDEVNNKLDEMAEDGTLEQIIGMYVTNDIVRVVNTRENLKTMTTLENGMKVKTLGCYEVGDGGNAFYKIETSTENETFDDSFSIELENGLKATLIIENDVVNFKAIGGRSQSTTNTLYDNKTILENFAAFNENYLRKLTLFVPGGVYGFTATNIASNKGFNIEGVYSYSQWKWNGSIFVPITSNQSYILKLGNNQIQSANISLKNIVFSGAIFEYRDDIKSFRIHSTGTPGNEGKITSNDIKFVTTCLDILYLSYSKLENIDFQYIIGTALSISTSWEINFNKLNFRNIQNYNDSIIKMKANDSSLSEYPNISACNFTQINAEAICGDVIKIANGCSFANNTFELINVEPNIKSLVFNDETITTLPNASYNESTATHFSILVVETGAQFSDIVINDIQCNNYPIAFQTYNTNQYIYDRIITQKETNSRFNYFVNNISIVGQSKNIDIIYYRGSIWRHYNQVTIGNYSSNNEELYNGIINVKNARNIFVKYNTQKMKTGSAKDNFEGYIPAFKCVRNLTDRNFGTISFDENSINENQLVASLINTVENPNINRQDLSIPLIGNTLLIRAMIPTNKQARITFTVRDESETQVGVLGATVFPMTTGDGLYHWYEIDLSSILNGVNCGYHVVLNHPNSIDTETYIDVVKTIYK